MNMRFVLNSIFIFLLVAWKIHAQVFPACSGVPCREIPRDVPKACIQDRTYRLVGSRVCYDCAYVKPNCGIRPNIMDRDHIPLCPGLRCPQFSSIPASCIRQGPIQWQRNLQRCRGCPAVDPLCPDLPLCDAGRCSPLPTGTPRSCVEQSVTELGNTVCLTCPFVKPGCQTDNNRLPPCKENQNSCNRIPRNIPRHCVMEGLLKISGGQICRGCPVINPSCILPISDGQPETKPKLDVIKQCPDNNCIPLVGIPVQCVKQPALRTMERGTKCRECPHIDPFCPALKLPTCTPRCSTIHDGASTECIHQRVLYYGRHCITCPTLKSECLPPFKVDTLETCPTNECRNIFDFPISCYKLGPRTTLNSGAICRGCPVVDRFCMEFGLPICPALQPFCPKLPADVPRACKTTDVIKEGTEECLSCPRIKSDPACINKPASPPTTPKTRLPDKPRRDPQTPKLPIDFPHCSGVTCLPTKGIPESCLSKAPIISQIDGSRCKACQVIDPFCPSLSLKVCPSVARSCNTLPGNTPNDCIYQRVQYENGDHCITCPVLKAECHEPGLKVCPNIPCIGRPPARTENCIEQHVLEYNGEECYSCPTLIPGCEDNPLTDNPLLYGL